MFQNKFRLLASVTVCFLVFLGVSAVSLSFRSSKHKLQANLHLARLAKSIHPAVGVGECARGSNDRSVSNRGVDGSPVCMVEDVIEIASEFKCHRFADLESFQQREVSVPQPRLSHHHSRCSPIARIADHLEGVDVKVPTFGFIASRQVRVSYEVGPVKARPGVGSRGAVADLRGIAGLSREDEVCLPSAQDLPKDSLLSFLVGDFIDDRRNQTVTDVKRRRRFVELPIEEEMKYARIAHTHRTLSLFCVADRVTPRVGNQEQC